MRPKTPQIAVCGPGGRKCTRVLLGGWCTSPPFLFAFPVVYVEIGGDVVVYRGIFWAAENPLSPREIAEKGRFPGT